MRTQTPLKGCSVEGKRIGREGVTMARGEETETISTMILCLRISLGKIRTSGVSLHTSPLP